MTSGRLAMHRNGSSTRKSGKFVYWHVGLEETYAGWVSEFFVVRGQFSRYQN